MTGIFRAYDIRGIYGKDLTEEIAKQIGAAFGTINKGTIAVGMDVRLSGPALKQELIEGLRSTGCNVIDMGMITTPMIIFAVGNYKLDGGVMVTASHNPKDYNGFKMFTKGAMPVSYESGLSGIEGLVKSGKFASGSGKVETKNILHDYENFLLSKVRLGKKMKLVVDAGNGSAGRVNCSVLRKAGFDVIELFCEPDGNFPNHVPDPTEPENIKKLREMVKESHADLGLAFDGDGDRLGIVDRHGNEISGNDVFIMLAKHALAKHKGGKIVINAQCSMAVEDCVRKHGGIPVDCKVGHTYIAQKMAEVGGIFAGELSGHYFFGEMFSGDDALFAGLKLLEFMSDGADLEKEISGIPRYHSEIAENIVIPVREEDKAPSMEMIRKMCIEKGYRFSDMDGIKILFKDGWAIFRPSNTSPLIRYGFEARNGQEFEKIRKAIEEIKARIGVRS